MNEYHIQSHISVHGTVSIIEKSDANAINCRPCAHVSDGNSLISIIENHLCSRERLLLAKLYRRNQS